MDKHIESLIAQAAKAKSSVDALHLSQAAANAANAWITLLNAKQIKN